MGVKENAFLGGFWGAELKHAYYIKKLEMIPFQPSTPFRALRTAITDRLDMTRAESSAVIWALENRPKWKREYVKAGYFNYPKEFEKPFVEEYVGLGRDYEKMVPFTSRDVDTNAIADSSGVCIFWTGFWHYPPISVDTTSEENKDNKDRQRQMWTPKPQNGLKGPK